MSNNRRKFTLFHRPLLLSMLTLQLFFSISSPVLAQSASGLSPEQKSLYHAGILNYDKGYLGCSESAGISINGQIGYNGSIAGIYNSGLKPPYILEMFMIHVLKRMAQITGKPESDFLTQEHVIALLAFAKGEGGDVANSSIFNPMNGGMDPKKMLGVDFPSGVWGGTGSDGRRGYPSFDIGVELYARQFLTGYQSRIGYILGQSNSTGEQFAHALTFYKEFPGNLNWAEASNNWPFKNPDGTITAGQQGYYLYEVSLQKQVRANYAERAGLVIGTTDLEERKGIYRKDLITYKNLVRGSSTTTGVTTTSSGQPDYSVFPDGDPPVQYRKNIPIIWSFLISKGLSPEQAAGIMGNIWQESRFQVNLDDPPAYGLIQWQDDRRTRLETFVKNRNTTVDDINAQLNFFWAELTGGYKTSTYEPLKKATSAAEAADIFLKNFEQPGNYDVETPRRANFANLILKAMKGVTSDPVVSDNCGTDSTVQPPTNGKLIYYTQDSGEFADLQLPGISKTVESSGCCLVSYSMAVANLTNNSSITPKTIIDWMNSSGYQYPSGERGIWLVKHGVTKFGVKGDVLNNGADIKQALSSGKYVIVSGQVADNDHKDSSPYTAGGHCVLLTSIDSSGKIHVLNPLKNWGPDRTYTIDQIMSGNSYAISVYK